jgi:hypothetical protein
VTVVAQGVRHLWMPKPAANAMPWQRQVPRMVNLQKFPNRAKAAMARMHQANPIQTERDAFAEYRAVTEPLAALWPVPTSGVAVPEGPQRGLLEAQRVPRHNFKIQEDNVNFDSWAVKPKANPRPDIPGGCWRQLYTDGPPVDLFMDKWPSPAELSEVWKALASADGGLLEPERMRNPVTAGAVLTGFSDK